MTEIGIVVVSHSKWIAQGLVDLISEVAKDVLLTYVGGTEDGGIGTSFEQVQTIVEANEAEKILAFFDLGSARMNLELVADFSDKDIIINYGCSFASWCRFGDHTRTIERVRN